MLRPTQIYEVEKFGLNKYEMVLLVSRRARHINAHRINLQHRHNVPLIEKDKPTNYALREILDNKLGYEYLKKKVAEEHVREIKKF